MGWTGLEGKGTHAEIDRELMRAWTFERDGQTVEVTNTDCTLANFGREHYHVRRENGAPVEIMVTMIERGKPSKDSYFRGSEWRYKDMCETMGPVIHACPLKLLAIVPPPTGACASYAADWREAVRKYHAAKTKAASRVLAVGTRFRLAESLVLRGVNVGGTKGTIIAFRKRTPVAALEAYPSADVLIPPKLIAEVLA